MPKTIVLTGGGSGGHVTPNLALIPYLKEKGYDIAYIGTFDGIEKELVTTVPYYPIKAGKLRRYASIKNISDPFRTISGYFGAKKLLKKLKPSVVFCKGGFVSVPVAFAAHSLKIPVVLHESDYTPGLANRLCAPKADKICLSFDTHIEKYAGKAVFTGSPVRRELLSGSKQKALSFCSLEGKKPILLTMGGSLGAEALNNAVDADIDRLLAKFDIIHLRGKGHLNPALSGKKGYCQFEYVSAEMPDLLCAADIVLSRSGANAVFELLALKKPALFVPLTLAQSRGDQILNAKYCDKNGFSMVLEQEQITPDTLFDTLCSLYESKKSYIEAIEKAGQSNGTQNVLDVIYAAEKK